MVNLTTMLAHSSGEWIASDWPVCAAGETTNPQRVGVALTYARRYALFTLVGIAGEDDLDAPDLAAPSPSGVASRSGVVHFPQSGRKSGNGRAAVKTAAAKTEPRATLDPAQSAGARDKLRSEIEALTSADHAATWARNAMSCKNTLAEADARQVEQAFEQKVTTLIAAESVDGSPPQAQVGEGSAPALAASAPAASDEATLAIAKPRRYRNKEHLRFIARQACLICGRRPSDPHHLRYAQPRALGLRQAMSSRCHSAERITARCTVLATNKPGGRPSASIPSASRRRSGTGPVSTRGTSAQINPSVRQEARRQAARPKMVRPVLGNDAGKRPAAHLSFPFSAFGRVLRTAIVPAPLPVCTELSFTPRPGRPMPIW
jgi:hypothetical protein